MFTEIAAARQVRCEREERGTCDQGPGSRGARAPSRAPPHDPSRVRQLQGVLRGMICAVTE